MDRRRTIALLPTLLLGAGACTERPSAQKVNVAPYSEKELHSSLDAMKAVLERKFAGTAKRRQPGLAESDIRQKTAWFPSELPAEVVGLYKWRNGYREGAGSKDPPFSFRDYVFSPLERVEKDYRSMMATYGAAGDKQEILKRSFPFASLGGGWLVLPSETHPFNSKFPRAVVSIFQGTSVFFYSMALMAQTCAAWLDHPKNDGFSLPEDEEMRIWRQFNPGIFQR